MELRCTRFGLAAVPASPVWRLNVPFRVVSWYWFTTQTGTFAASRGRGAPKVAPFRLPAPVAPVPVHSKVLVPSQPLRQYFRVEPSITGKLWDVPVHPLSRSLPLPSSGCAGSAGGGTVRVICLGAPGESVRAGQTAVVVPEVPDGTHCTRSLLAKPL